MHWEIRSVRLAQRHTPNSKEITEHERIVRSGSHVNNRVSRIWIRRIIHVDRIATINTERIMHVSCPDTTPLSYWNSRKDIAESSTVARGYTHLEGIVERRFAKAERISGKQVD